MTRAETVAPTRRSVAAFLGAALVAGLTVLAAPPAASATPWLPEVEVTDGSAYLDRVVSSIGPDGTFVVAWAESVDGTATSMRVQVATRAPGAAEFSAPVEVAPAGDGVSGVDVVVDGTGATTVAWVRAVASGSRVEAARRLPGRLSFGAPATVAVSGQGIYDLVGVGDPVGRVTLAWLVDLGVQQGHAATWEPALAGWSDPIPVTTPGMPYQMKLSVDGTGAVTAAWLSVTDGDYLLQTRTRPAGGAVFGPVLIHSAADGLAYYVDLASNAAGATVLVWWQREGSDFVLRVAARSPGAALFGDSVVVATIAADRVSGAPLAAVDGVGTVTIAWMQSHGQSSLLVATRQVGGSFSAPALVATSATPMHGVSLSSSGGIRSGGGATLLAWTEEWREATGNSPARAVYRPAGGEFGAPVDLTAPVAGVVDIGVVASVDAAGDAHVAWARARTDEKFPSHVHARVLDATAPGLLDVAVPATGTAGTPVAVTAAATDLWSGPASIAWDFGDGGTAIGASASHQYSAAGSYVVRVTATDGAGNTTSVTRTIDVGPGAVQDGTAPVLSKARLMPGLLPTGEGARLKVASSERASLAGVVQRKRDGKWRPVGTKRWSLRAGANTRIFYGKTSEQRLRSGNYRVRLVATDPAGNVSTEARLRFRVERG